MIATSNGEPILEGLPICVPKVLLPRKGVDLNRWACVACDQFESEPQYWSEMDDFCGNAPSTLRLIFPEVYLASVTGAPPEEDAKRIQKINETMLDYVRSGVFDDHRPPAFVALDRRTPHVPSRKGLIVAVDLEEYNYNCPEPTLIRPTEKTIVARLPPRIAVREKAPLELPHIIMIIDDPEKTVIEPLFANASLAEPEYDVEVFKGAGGVKGFRVTEAGTAHFERSMKALTSKEVEAAKASGRRPSSILIGDGNHSLATAKSCWDALKAEGRAGPDHPARYALVELQNLYDDGVVFEPIHRVLNGAKADDLQDYLEKAWGCTAKPYSDPAPLHSVVLVRGGSRPGRLVLEPPADRLPIVSASAAVDAYVAQDSSITISYVHGEEPVEAACREGGAAGLLLPKLDKTRFLGTIHQIGTLPRKAFSMGEAEEKRFYLEARRIVPAASPSAL